MLFEKPLDSILGQASKLKLLRFLIKTNAQMNGRELARAVKLSHVKCHSALKELETHGLVISKIIGSSIVYSISKEHFIYKELLRPLIERESKILNNLSEMIIAEFKKQKPITLALFGSVARMEERPESDIDLLVIIPSSMSHKTAEAVFESLDEKVILKFGNQLAPLIVTEKEFKLKIEEKESLYTEIFRTGKILYGKDFIEVLK